MKSARQAEMSLETLFCEFSSTFLHFSDQEEALNGWVLCQTLYNKMV